MSDESHLAPHTTNSGVYYSTVLMAPFTVQVRASIANSQAHLAHENGLLVRLLALQKALLSRGHLLKYVY